MEKIESLPIGALLDSGLRKYKIESVLGQGGFGITYLATSTIQLDNIPVVAQFAIKEHYISSMNERQGTTVAISNANNTEEIKESIDSFLVEAQRLNKLSLNHNGLVRVNESFRANGTAYYVMEYIKGQSLRAYVKHSPQGRLSEAEALQLFHPIAKTIGYLHDNMVTHLDIKPDNILIRENGEPVVIDFGLSKHYSSKGTPTSTIKAAGCSAGYSPMEQYAGITTFSPEADIYALGATLLYMLTGKDPMISTEVKSGYVASVLSGLASDSIIVAISHAMAKLSEERTHSISDLFSDLVGSGSEGIYEHAQPQTPHDNNKTKKKIHVAPDDSMEEEDYVANNPTDSIRGTLKRMFDLTGRSFWPAIGLVVIGAIVALFIWMKNIRSTPEPISAPIMDDSISDSILEDDIAVEIPKSLEHASPRPVQKPTPQEGIKASSAIQSEPVAQPDKTNQMISEMEELIEKTEKVKDNPDKVMEFVGEFAKLGEKYKDLKEEDFTPEQAKKIEELGEKLERMFE